MIVKSRKMPGRGISWAFNAETVPHSILLSIELSCLEKKLMNSSRRCKQEVILLRAPRMETRESAAEESIDAALYSKQKWYPYFLIENGSIGFFEAFYCLRYLGYE